MDTPTPAAVESPCADICELNAEDVCIGCGRRLEEIGDWLNVDEAQRGHIVALARQRMAAFSSAQKKRQA